MANFLEKTDNSTYGIYDAYSDWYFRQRPVVEVYRTNKSSKFYNPIVADGFRRDLSFNALEEASEAAIAVHSASFGMPFLLILLGLTTSGFIQTMVFTIAALVFLSYPLFALYSRIVLKSTDKATVNLEHLGFNHETSKEDLISYFKKNTAQAEEFIELTIEENMINQKLDHIAKKIEESNNKSGNSETIDFVVKDIEKKTKMLENRLLNVQSEIESLVAPILEEIEAKIVQDKEQELLSVASSM